MEDASGFRDDLVAAVDRLATQVYPDLGEWDIAAALRWLSNRYRKPQDAKLIARICDGRSEPADFRHFRQEAASHGERLKSL